jgi:hypothetical protein
MREIEFLIKHRKFNKAFFKAVYGMLEATAQDTNYDGKIVEAISQKEIELGDYILFYDAELSFRYSPSSHNDYDNPPDDSYDVDSFEVLSFEIWEGDDLVIECDDYKGIF